MTKKRRSDHKRKIAMAGAGVLGATALLLVPSVGEAGSPAAARAKHAELVDKKIKKVCAVHDHLHATHPKLPPHKHKFCPPASP